MDEEPVDEHPLLWWRKNCSRYPTLTVLAKKYLAIPATSVPQAILSIKRGPASFRKREHTCFLAENLLCLLYACMSFFGG